MISIHPQYIKDINGKKSLVILPAKEFAAIIEGLEDIKIYDEAKKEDKGERILFYDYLKHRNQKGRLYCFLIQNSTKQLDKLSDLIAKPILVAISKLATNLRPAGCKKLKGRDGFRLRVGNYRILYDIYDTELVVDVIALGHRKEVYR